VSRELSGQLANAIKFRASSQWSHQTYNFICQDYPQIGQRPGLLIKIMMECDGRPIEAIIDTGSQLNIVSEKACKSSILRPIDCSVSISMNDANGGEGSLETKSREFPSPPFASFIDMLTEQSIGRIYLTCKLSRLQYSIEIRYRLSLRSAFHHIPSLS